MAATAHIGQLKPDPRNARRHNPRNVGQIETSIQRDGFGRSVLLANDGTIIAGNATIDAAASAGLEDVIVVETDGTKVVAVKRTDVEPGSRQFYNLAVSDNRAAELADWDASNLESLIADDLIDPSGFWTDDELDAALARLAEEPVAGLTDPDAVPEPPKVARTKPGDVWQLGRHRLMCGDSANPDHVAALMDGQTGQLMATDPPYGVDFAGAKYNPRAKAWDGIEGDKRQGDDLRAWLAGILAIWLPYIDDDSAYYCWAAAMEAPSSIAAAIRDVGLHIQSQIIWVKNALVLGQADYQWRHENCWYAFKKGAQHRWFGGRAQTTVWDIDKVANAEYVHPMQKPTELFAIPMRNHTKAGDICVDPFAGSGSQFVAAEQEGRRCFGMEVDPIHATTILERFEQFTGQTATLLAPAEAVP